MCLPIFLYNKTYPCYFSIGQSQDSFPVGAIDEEAVWLGDGCDIGPQGGTGPMGNGDHVSAQLSLPAALCVGDVHAAVQVFIWGGPMTENCG